MSLNPLHHECCDHPHKDDLYWTHLVTEAARAHHMQDRDAWTAIIAEVFNGCGCCLGEFIAYTVAAVAALLDELAGPPASIHYLPDRDAVKAIEALRWKPNDLP